MAYDLFAWQLASMNRIYKNDQAWHVFFFLGYFFLKASTKKKSFFSYNKLLAPPEALTKFPPILSNSKFSIQLKYLPKMISFDVIK